MSNRKEDAFILMLLKAVLWALSLVFGGLGVLQVSAIMENYLLLGAGLVLTTFGVVALTGQRRATAA